MRALVLILALAGCASGGSAGASREARGPVEGIYEFFANIPYAQTGTQSTLRVRGTISVVDDSVYVQPDASCVPASVDERGVPNRWLAFNCMGASLTFERSNPTAARWSSYVQVPRLRNVCVDYAPRPATGNAPRCLQWRRETYYTRELRSGTIQVKRID